MSPKLCHEPMGASGSCSLSPLPPAESATSALSLQGLCLLLGAGWLSPGGMCWKMWPSQNWGARGEEAARGSGVRLALNPQKSPYLEQCSIHLLISPLALISLLVLLPQCCFRAGRGEGSEGAAQEGAGSPEHACAGDAPTSQGQLCLVLLGSGPAHPSKGSRVSSGLGPWLRGVFQAGGWRSSAKISSLLPSHLLARASSDTQTEHPPNAKSSSQEPKEGEGNVVLCWLGAP